MRVPNLFVSTSQLSQISMTFLLKYLYCIAQQLGFTHSEISHFFSLPLYSGDLSSISQATQSTRRPVKKKSTIVDLPHHLRECSKCAKEKTIKLNKRKRQLKASAIQQQKTQQCGGNTSLSFIATKNAVVSSTSIDENERAQKKQNEYEKQATAWKRQNQTAPPLLASHRLMNEWRRLE